MTHERSETAAEILGLVAPYVPTPLRSLPSLAALGGVGQVMVKDEGERYLGSFKSLGGMFAGLRAMVRATGMPSVRALVEARLSRDSLPTLLCASDGNHGLAVAAAAQLTGGTARVYLHRRVAARRAQRIADRRAEIVWVDGTYDDSVDEALRASQRGAGLLIPDTAADPNDPVVADVLLGYELIAAEIADQLVAQRFEPPTHLFVQAGVGGLAAAMTKGLREGAARSCQTIVVEPAAVACVGLALRLGRAERMVGDLHSAAEMLSCGEASTAALKVLQYYSAQAIAVDESSLEEAVRALRKCDGPPTTLSGATGLAGFLAATNDPRRRSQFAITNTSRVLLIATEAA